MGECAVLLDLDDTLVIQREVLEEAFFATCAAAWAECDIEPEALTQSVKLHARRLWAECEFVRYFERIGLSASEGLWAGFEGAGDPMQRMRPWAHGYQREAWRRALADHGVKNEPLAKELAAMFQEECWASFALFHDTIPTVETLARQYRLALVTNGLAALQRKKIECAGFGAHFEAVVISGELGAGKPEAIMYGTALERLGIPRGRAVMVGNNLEWDVAGPQRIGVKGIWANMAGEPARESVRPDATVASLGELPGVVASLLGQ